MGLFGSFLQDIGSFAESIGEEEQIQKKGVIRLPQSRKIDEEIAAKTISRAYCVISTCVMIEDILKGV